MAGSGKNPGLLNALIVADAVMIGGVMASQGSDWQHSDRSRALVVFGLAFLLAAAGALWPTRRPSPPGAMGAAAIESPDDLKGIEFALAVVSVVASVVGAILSAVGLG
ncbi:MAG TPA: hypothetical protein VG227_02255 [Caulobacteraceae bacterium]|nr:hypothetical protein [Caulobacteraceae bacterium]